MHFTYFKHVVIIYIEKEKKGFFFKGEVKMFEFKKIKLDDGTRIKVERVIYDKIYNSGYNSDQNSILKEYIERESGRVNYKQGDITKELKLTLKLFPIALLECLAFSLPFGICMYTGLFKYAPLGTGLFGYLGVAAAISAGIGLGEGLSLAIYEYRNKKIFSKAKDAIEKQLEKNKTVEKKEIENKEISYDVVGEDKKVVKTVRNITTTHSPIYEDYKEYMISKGANKELFDLQAINDIIDGVIEYGDDRLKMEGKSPIYYKNPNKDGTFDICGRMAGPCVTLVYKMEYCNDDNPEHYIVLKKYEQKSHHEGNFFYIDGCVHNKIYINKDGIIVDETDEMKISGFKDNGFLKELHEKKLIKSII